MAANKGHADAAQKMITHHADVHAKDNVIQLTFVSSVCLCLNYMCCDAQNGWTSLHTAAHAGYTEIVRILLEERADIEAKDNVSATVLLCLFIENLLPCSRRRDGLPYFMQWMKDKLLLPLILSHNERTLQRRIR